MFATKPSGFSGIGDIPAEWEVKPLKYCVGINKEVILESTGPDYAFRYVDIGSVTYADGITGYEETTFEKAPSRARRKVHKGDTIVSTVRTYLKAIARIKDDQDVIASTGFAVLSPVSMDSVYLEYFCKSEPFGNEVDRQSSGIAYPAVNASQIGRIYTPLPSMIEQHAIAAFLDERCGYADSIITDLEQQAEILQQYKKALITETVTKGLDKSTPMKNSGIDWICEMPRHWETKRIKYCANKIGSGKTPLGGAEIYEEQGVTFLRSQNVYDDGLRLDDVVYIHPRIDNSMPSTRVLYNDVLFNITGASIGRCCVYDRTDRANVNQHVCIIRTNPDLLLSEFLRYVLNSDIGQTQVIACQMGGNRESVTFEQLGAFNIVVPPLIEQQEIINRLSNACAEIDTLISEKQRAAETMRQYKKSLIYEYVTGKKRVTVGGVAQ